MSKNFFPYQTNAFLIQAMTMLYQHCSALELFMNKYALHHCHRSHHYIDTQVYYYIDISSIRTKQEELKL